jgi:uncharacterized membrane protein
LTVNYQRGSTEERGSRSGAGIIGGYVGFVFGLLVVLSMASELEALPIHVSAVVVLIHMAAGYALGWLIQPLIKALFPH